VLLALVSVILLGAGAAAQPAGATYPNGNVFAGVGAGLIKQFTPTGTLVSTLDTGSGSAEDTGMAFDQAGNLYATAFTVSNVFEFDSNGNLIGPFGSGYDAGHAESIVFDIYGNAYVGQPDGPKTVLKFSPSGTLLATFSPVTGNPRGTDWVDLAADQCTLHYTTETDSVKRFNVCTNTQLSDFVSGLAGPCYAHRIRSNGEEIVTCHNTVYRLNGSGGIIQTYTPTGQSSAGLFAMNLDPDGTTFWTADYGNGNVWHINIATGAGAGAPAFNAGIVGASLGGLAVAGELTALPKLSLSPNTDTKPVGATETLTAQTTNDVAPLGRTITFTVTGPNAQTGTATTNASGTAMFTYTGNNAGVDTVVATTTLVAGYPIPVPLTSNTSTITWTKAPTNLAFTATSPTTQHFNDPVTVSATLTSQVTGAGIPGETLSFTLDGQAACTSGPTDAAGTASCTITPNEAAGLYPLTVSFAGDTNYQPSSATEGFVVTKEDTSLSSTTALQVFAQGGSATLTSTLVDPVSPGEPASDAAPIAGQPVTMTLANTANPASNQSCTGTTDPSGTATCTISPVSVALGPATITDSFVDLTNHYQAATNTERALVFAFATGGSFTIGDLTAHANGNSVNFWGAKWAKNNSLSGGAAPNAFKGFENSVPAPACGGTWTTDPGNSSDPPAGALPSYMGVIVSSSISKLGPNISGDVKQIIVVTTDPGYADNPGHPGTGTVVATFCP
jgi:Big-like domain-containing protein